MFNRFSTNGSPVNIRFPQGFELPPQYFILRTLCTGIMLYNIFGYRTDVLQQLSVTGNIRNFQIEGDTTLLRPFQVTGTAQLPLFQSRHLCVPLSPVAYEYLRSVYNLSPKYNKTGRRHALPDRATDAVAKVRNVQHSL